MDNMAPLAVCLTRSRADHRKQRRPILDGSAFVTFAAASRQPSSRIQCFSASLALSATLLAVSLTAPFASPTVFWAVPFAC